MCGTIFPVRVRAERSTMAWQDCAVLKSGLLNCFGFESRQVAETNIVYMAQKRINGLIWVREDDEYEYYASSMNEY